eukprot:GDKH01004227.1.p5 GENE.GDKH01004227.1~~GDKH01004227.1.p5  ORF type:complete len:57 (+),score=7.18 GDKH01004227.1:121-291(+)
MHSTAGLGMLEAAALRVRHLPFRAVRVAAACIGATEQSVALISAVDRYRSVCMHRP